MGRGKKWSTANEEALCHAWLQVIQDQDVVGGVTKRNLTFWTRIQNAYAQSGDKTRTLRSIQNRWCMMSVAVKRFGDIFDQIHAAQTSGQESDSIKAALQTYSVTHPKKETFDFIECWHILRKSPNWGQLQINTKKISSPGRLSGEEGASKPQSLPAPNVPEESEGRHSMSFDKETLPLHHKKPKITSLDAHTAERQLAAYEESNRIAEEKMKTFKLQTHTVIFSMHEDQIPEGSREYFDLVKSQILEEVRQSGKNSMQSTREDPTELQQSSDKVDGHPSAGEAGEDATELQQSSDKVDGHLMWPNDSENVQG